MSAILKHKSNLPPTADMVYLEWCYEACSNIWYNQNYPSLGRAVEPSCSAAILFTVQGARKVANLCLPIFDAIDRMYPILIRKVHRILESLSLCSGFSRRCTSWLTFENVGCIPL
jgi:hypothetical protein